MKTETVTGIEYTKPQVYLLNDSGLGVAEYAGRTAYNSFDKSENVEIKTLNYTFNKGQNLDITQTKNLLNDVIESKLLEQLTWVHFHESVLEHINFSFLVKGTSRGVLQELSRHRIASYTVQSTRYTMSPIINAFNASENIEDFISIVRDFNFLVISSKRKLYDIEYIYKTLQLQFDTIGSSEFLDISTSKEQKSILLNNEHSNAKSLFEKLEKAKQKRNVGDSFKHIVTDNWKVDLVMTINLRSLKNFLNLRDNGAAYFQMQWLAQEMKKSLPDKYLPLIDKG